MLEATRPLPRHELPGERNEPRRAPRVLAAVVALLAALGVHLTWRVFVATTTGQRVDELAFTGAQHGQNRLWTVAEPLLDVVSVAFVVASAVVAVLVAVMRRRWTLALQVATIVVGSNVTTQLAKHVIYERPDLLPGWNGPNALPSGHTTVAASVSAAMLVAVPRGWRPLVAVLGAAWTSAMGISTLVGQWHRPSDVIAALLVVLAWGAGVCAVGSRSSLDIEPRPGASMASPGSSVVAGLLALGGAVAAFIAGIALADLATGVRNVPFEGDVTAYAGGMAGVLAVTAVVFALLLVVRQATARPQR